MSGHRNPLPLFAIIVASLSLVGCAVSNQSVDGLSDAQIDSINASVPSLDEHIQGIYEGYDDFARELLGLSSAPDVEIVRQVSWEEADQVRQECMLGYGFSPQEGTNVWSVPEGQDQLYLESMLRCNMSYPIKFEHTLPWNYDQRSRAYDYVVETLIPCLENEGYIINHDAIPSRSVYIETIETDRAYYPNTDLIGQIFTNEEEYRINVVCPQRPPVSVLYD